VPEDPLIGRVLDRRYEIVARIARGGMATVYEAYDRRLDRTVAIKIMHAGMGDDEAFAARFVREARAAAQLAHPNVVAVYDQGTESIPGHGTVPFLVMELVRGHTLRDVINAQAPMPPARAIAYLEPVVAALSAAHRAGLVHRDVKPENVLIAGDGTMKVADFGLARAVSAHTQHTSTGVLMGSVSYIAPELVVDGTADARADVYASGVMLYELLTGQKPHAGETPIQVAYKHVHEDVAPPSIVMPGIPDYVDALVVRATARDRSRRPADADVLMRQVRMVAQALAAGEATDPGLVDELAVPAMAGAEVGAPEPTAIYRAPTPPRHAAAPPGGGPTTLPRRRHEEEPPRRSPRRRRFGPVMMLGALLVAIVVGVGAWWLGAGRYTTTPGVLQLTPEQATTKLESAGFKVETGDPQFSDSVAKGLVMATDPAPGERVLHGGTVTITVSKGIEQYPVPNVKGDTYAQAKSALEQRKMDVPPAEKQWSLNVPIGKVIGTDPKVGEILRPGTSVTVYVSKGPQPVQVPDLTGKDFDKTVKKLEAEGLVVNPGEAFDKNVPKGAVASQDPGPGTLHQGDSITLVESKGPRMVVLPPMKGEHVEDVEKKLDELGVKYREMQSPYYLGLGLVGSTSPGEGQKVPVGSTVTLYLV